MSVYQNTCGKFELTVSEPWPMWVSIKASDPRLAAANEDFPALVSTDDLHDLKHLIERALTAVAERERR